MPYKDPEKRKEYHRRRALVFKRMRAEGVDVARFILREARRSDKLRGVVCDLTKAQIETLIAKGCDYCGEMNLRMTIGRLDNSKGHMLSYVVLAFFRCNRARRTMP